MYNKRFHRAFIRFVLMEIKSARCFWSNPTCRFTETKWPHGAETEVNGNSMPFSLFHGKYKMTVLRSGVKMVSFFFYY